MQIRMTLAALFAAALVPASALGEPVSPPEKESAARTCKALQTSLGAATFTATYGSNADKSNAFGKCVSRTVAAERRNRAEAAKACAAEQADPNFAAGHGGKTFAEFYGVGKRGAAAMQRCVKSKREQETAEDKQATLNAAKQCKAERKLDPAAFEAEHGGKANAFGKCVSKLAQEHDEDDKDE